MARTVHVYPKALIVADQWTYLVKVGTSRFPHTITAGVTAEIPMRLLKVSWDMIVADLDTDQDVDNALFTDTASGGPTNGETLWQSWQDVAEGKIASLTTGYTQADFFAAWSKQNTARIRNAARRILINGRGWTIVAGSVHQHEGDGTNTDE